MKKIFHYSCVAILSIVAHTTIADEANQNTNQKILAESDQRIAFFYEKPNKEDFQLVQKNYSKVMNALPAVKRRNMANSIFWVNQVAKKHQWEINKDFFPDFAKQFNNPNSSMSKAINGETKATPQILDVWWASFFATGDTIYVERILSYAEQKPAIEKRNNKRKSDKGKKGKINIVDFLVASAAEWSFISNCKMHKPIRTFAADKLSQPSISKEALALLQQCK